MNFFRKLFVKSEPAQKPNEECVLVHLDGSGLSDEVYEQYDTSTLEDELSEILEAKGLGEFDGNEFGPGETTLFMYGADAEKLFEGIESALRAYPLCEGARVTIRRGPPGSEQRVVQL